MRVCDKACGFSRVCVCLRLGEVEGACASEKWGRGCGPVGPSFMKALLYRPTLTHYA